MKHASEIVDAQKGDPSPQERPKGRLLKVLENSRGRVLVVEDEVELIEILEFNLLRLGFDVLVAEDGLEACRMIGREKPDLILLDLLLPLLNGWEICRMVRLHHDPLIARTPIIMLSALGSVEDRLKGYDLGADLYLAKPYVMKEVLLKTGQLITQRRDYLELAGKVQALENWTALQEDWQHALFHELRNQLTMISGMAEHLKSSESIPRQRSREFVEHISSSSDYLGTLAMNYLLVREVETDPGCLPLEPVLLQSLVGQVVGLFQQRAERCYCQLQYDCDELPPLRLHPVGLKIILSNLFDNALKYSSEAGRISLDGRRLGNVVEIAIQDSGPGIAEEERERVFDRFYRGQILGKTGEGNGLGLYMARTLAQAMGGELRLDEKVVAGCRFLLRFPVE